MDTTTDTRSYVVPQMHCGSCRLTVVEELSELAEVDSVDVDLDARLVTVRGDGLRDDVIRATLAEVGYEPRPA